MALGQNVSVGLAKVEIAPIAGDGGAGTVFSELGKTLPGSAAITSVEPTTSEIREEESDTPIYSSTTGGGYEVAWTTQNVDVTVLQELFGGTLSGVAPNQIWSAPDVIPNVERTVRMTSLTGWYMEMPRVKLRPSLNMTFQRESAAQIAITGTVLTPTKAGVKSLYGGQEAEG